MPLYLVRHAHAGSRHKWDGPDELRPLSRKGRGRAEEIGELLAGCGVERVLSSPLVRCVQSVEPLAARIGTEVERSDPLREGASLAESIGLVEELAAAGTTAVLCSHGDVIPEVLTALARRGARLDRDGALPKGSIWVLDVAGGVVTDARYAGSGPPPSTSATG